jgi:hypothetical protein
MITLAIDQKTSEQLGQATELAELRNADGRLVGYFVAAKVRFARMWAEAPDHVDTVSLVNGSSRLERSSTTRQVFEHILNQAQDERGKDDLRQSIERMKAKEAAETLEPEPPPEPDAPFEMGGPPGDS